MNVKKVVKISLITILVLIVLAIPIVIFLKDDDREKQYNNMVDDIKEAAIKYMQNNQLSYDDERISLGNLKHAALLSFNMINPKTDKHLSNESYVSVKNGEYEVKLYDLPDVDYNANLIVTMNGDQTMQNGIGIRYVELGVNFYDEMESLSYSIQYFSKGKEVANIDTSRPSNFDVVYSTLNKDGKLAKITRKVIIQ